VGKSSLINRMMGKKSTQVGDRPGVTKGKQWLTLKNGMQLLDTPGILWPKFEDPETGLHLAFTGAIRDEIMDVPTLAAKLLEKLSSLYPDRLAERYKLDDIRGKTGAVLLEEAGRKRGCLVSGGEIDFNRIGNIVLDEFRAARIGRITLETPS